MLYRRKLFLLSSPLDCALTQWLKITVKSRIFATEINSNFVKKIQLMKNYFWRENTNETFISDFQTLCSTWCSIKF